MAILHGGPTAKSMTQDSTVLYADDIAYAESNTTFSVGSGSVSGSAVTFGLGGASASSTTVANGPAVSGVDYQSYASTVATDLGSGAASGSALSIDTSGYSLPLQADTYLPASISGTWNGTDFVADTSWNGTVLAHAGFNTDNPDIDMSTASVSLGYVSDVPADGGGGGCARCEIQTQASSFSYGDGYYFMPLAFTKAVKDKSYKVNTKKWAAGETSFSSGKIKKWNSNVPNTENLDEVGVSVDTSALQYDAVTGTLNVKQQIRLKKAPKAPKKNAAPAA
jgi:hypothetical protein